MNEPSGGRAPSTLPDYDTTQFRGYAPILRETFAVLAEDAPHSDLDIPRKTLDDLQWGALLEALSGYCVSEEARLVALRLPFLQHRESIQRRLREVEEAVSLITTDLAPPLSGLVSTGAALEHARRGGLLEAEQLLAVARVARIAEETHHYAQSRARVAPLLAQLASDLQPTPELVRTLQRAFDPAGRLADHASPDLGELRRRVSNYHDRLKRRIDQYLRDQDFQTNLQDNYYTLRSDRYVLPIRSGARGQVPGIVHGTSNSGQTLFIEPTELVELNNDLRLAQMEVAEEERRILLRLTGLVREKAPYLEANIDLLAYLDLTCAMARLAIALRAHRPELSTRGALSLRQARHPLLVLKALHSDSPFTVIPNDMTLGLTPEDKEGKPLPRQQILMISGPNTGGKTVTLKTLGLCCLMARAGLHVTADPGGELPLVGSIFSDIGDEQSIERDLSTFSGHVSNINGFLGRVTGESLVLLDELFVGTDPVQGAALARALLTWLAEQGALVAVTTHLETLKTLAFEDQRFSNASVGFDLQALRPTYQLHIGLPGSSYALRIAQRLGMPAHLIDTARSYTREQGQADLEKVLRELERQRELLFYERDQARGELVEAERARQRYERELAALHKKEQAMIHEDTRRLMVEIEKAREQVRQSLRLLKEATAEKALTHEELIEQRKQLDEQAARAAERLKQREQESIRKERAQVKAGELAEGDEVWVTTFKRAGTVSELQEDRGRAVVQVGGIRATVALGELYHLKNGEGAPRARASAATAPEEPNASPGVFIAPQSQDNTVDLRGMRADEAMERLEIFLDAAYRTREPGIYIIHGHGTGALKRAVREYLPTLTHLARYRPGERTEGGDGVTVAYFRG
jgi:DNA mismatch repair protein MutS2